MNQTIKEALIALAASVICLALLPLAFIFSVGPLAMVYMGTSSSTAVIFGYAWLIGSAALFIALPLLCLFLLSRLAALSFRSLLLFFIVFVIAGGVISLAVNYLVNYDSIQETRQGENAHRLTALDASRAGNEISVVVTSEGKTLGMYNLTLQLGNSEEPLYEKEYILDITGPTYSNTFIIPYDEIIADYKIQEGYGDSLYETVDRNFWVIARMHRSGDGNPMYGSDKYAEVPMNFTLRGAKVILND